MNTRKLALWATTALVGTLLSTTGAFAQSTGSREIDDTDEASDVEAVVVTGTRGARSIEGVVRNETAPKARTSIDQAYISTQPAGQTIFQSLNQTPGLNFTNNDPYGSSGGNVRLRGQDGNRVALLWDGMPLNDTGNYAIFTNQLLDPEFVSQVNVNTGTADVDSPSPAAVGGTINYTTIRPQREFGGMIQPSVGSWDYKRILGRLDSGDIGPFDTRGWAGASYQNYDKWRGPGELEKKQGNAYAYQQLRGEDFVGLGIHYNENRNHQYRQLRYAEWLASGGGLDNDKVCIRPTPGAGVQNDSTQSTVITSQDQTVTGTSCTNYYELRNNPSNTGNIRGQGRFTLTDRFVLTADPFFQYVLANGGGSTVVAETDGRLRGASTAAGVDLNGDGDTVDSETIYTPSNTNTRRYGLTTSLLYELAENHNFRIAYTVDYGRHRQTGEAGFVTKEGAPENVFAGKEGQGRKVSTADGSFYRSRDRFSIASLQQIAAQYRGRLLDERLVLDIGVRAPFFKRELNQFCYTQDAAAGALIAGFNVRCTTETPVAQANGTVRFASTGTTEFIRPYELDVEYDAVLPNVGASYEFIDNHRVFASYARGFAAPRTDNLYTVGLIGGQVRPAGVLPEESDNWDVGYRYSAPGLIVYFTAFHNEFTNRIVQSFDPEFGISLDRNVGTVVFKGFDFQVGWDPVEQVTLSTFFSALNAKLQENIPGSTAGSTIATQGKTLVEVPDVMFGGRATVRPFPGFRFSLQGKFTGRRFANDLNTEQAPEYVVWDFDARYNLNRFGRRFEGSYLQLNVNNLFGEDYLGSINSGTGAQTGLYQIGAPTTVQMSLRAEF